MDNFVIFYEVIVMFLFKSPPGRFPQYPVGGMAT
jgi:hypothetical protein